MKAWVMKAAEEQGNKLKLTFCWMQWKRHFGELCLCVFFSFFSVALVNAISCSMTQRSSAPLSRHLSKGISRTFNKCLAADVPLVNLKAFGFNNALITQSINNFFMES